MGSEGELHIIIILSAYNFILCSDPLTLIPEIRGDSLIHAGNSSTPKAKIEGDNGQPCLMLWEIWNEEERNPEVYTTEGMV